MRAKFTRMKQALVIGASGGIGQAVARELAARQVRVDGLSRSADGLDVTREASVAARLGKLHGEYDLIFVATGALASPGSLPEKAISQISEEAMSDLFRMNAIGPMLLLKHSLRLLPKNRRSVFAVLSARVGSIGDNAIGGWHSYRSSKAALNQLIHGASIEMRRTHREAIAICLHPGTVATPFTEKYAQRHKTVPADVAATNLLNVIESLTPEQSGSFVDYAGRHIEW